MSDTGWVAGDGDGRERVSAAALITAVLAAVLGAGQLWVGNAVGVLAWRGDESPGGVVDESAIVVWITAATVSLAAAAPILLRRTAPSASLRRRLVAMAVVGASITAPVAIGIASWQQMFGGDLPQSRIMLLVTTGVVLGGGVAFLTARSQPAAWSQLYWLVIGWGLMCVSVAADPRTSPTLGHLDPGPDWSADSRQWQGRLVLLAVAAVVGTTLGASARILRWRVGCHGPERPLLPVLSTAAGPGLMLTSYAVAAGLEGQWRIGPLADLVAAGFATVLTGYLGITLIRRCRPAPATGT
ncbi:hypothetical protein LX16_4145 [Stackebrandtia albiflava]|uniref:Uncharacterized protein n=1 Tax=Stackebrandtia albiflava TaxID=406432 RepID=A0A562UYP7_9ACTN|nr:hypothetical protein [Stackebrandtia albiflava]TWJ10723.1 hypothetical protein LX16_4145 [Stackebrandtia albiflava]